MSMSVSNLTFCERSKEQLSSANFSANNLLEPFQSAYHVYSLSGSISVPLTNYLLSVFVGHNSLLSGLSLSAAPEDHTILHLLVSRLAASM